MVVSDPLPAGSGTGVTWTIDGAADGFSLGGVAGAQTLNFGPATLAAGESHTVHIVATTSATECSTYDNTANVTTTNDGEDEASASTTCNPADIDVAKTADAASVNAGEQIGFTVTVTNNGTGSATGVVVSDPLPAGSGTGVTWTIDGAADGFSLGGVAGAQTLNFGPATLAAGESHTVHIVATTSATECSTYDNTANVTTTNDGEDEASASTTCNPADIDVAKTADAASVNAGEQIGFTVTVTNNGTGSATGVVVSDPLPAGSGTGVTWTIDGAADGFSLGGVAGAQTLNFGPATLAAGESHTVHIVATTSATECSTYDNTANVTTTNDGEDEASASTTCNPADIDVAKTADAASVNAGEQIGFTVTVTNNGTGSATGVVVSDPLPAGSGTGVTWTIDGAADGFSLGGVAGAQTLNFGPATLAAGESHTVHIVATTSATECSTYDNTANVTTTNDGEDEASASTDCNLGDIDVEKTADAASVNAGEQIGFTVTVTNTGTGALTGATVSDPLPAGSGTGVTWTIDGAADGFSLGGVAGAQTLNFGPAPLAAGPAIPSTSSPPPRPPSAVSTTTRPRRPRPTTARTRRPPRSPATRPTSTSRRSPMRPASTPVTRSASP